mgnify:CR=1 FL=1
MFGFAVGAGFAVFENLFYLMQAEHRSLLVWFVRGFGTAIMHGGTTATVVIVLDGRRIIVANVGDSRAVVGVATKAGTESPWFTGGTVTIDGVVLHEYRLVYNTKGAAPGSKSPARVSTALFGA